MYSKANEKRSLWGYYVFLTGEKTNRIEASTGLNMSKNQTEAAKNIETAIIPGKIIDDVKNKEEVAPSAGPVKETGKNDIKMENITGERPSIIRQNESFTEGDGKLTDIKPSYTGPTKEAEIIAKITDKIEKTETAERIVPAEHVVQTEKHIEPDALQPPSGHYASVDEMNLPAGNSLLTEQQSAAMIEKGKVIDKGKPAMAEQIKSIQGEKKLSIITTENNKEIFLPQKGSTDAVPSPALKAKDTVPVRQQKDYPETPKTAEVILSGTDQPKKENAIPSSAEHARMAIEQPVIASHPSSEKVISETEITLPERNSQISGPLSAEMTEKAARIEKGEAKIEKPLAPDQTLAVNNVIRAEKKAIYTADENKKALSEKVIDTPEDKKTLPLITEKKPAEKDQFKKSSEGIPSSASKTEEAVSVQNNEKGIEAPKASVNPESSKKAIQAESSAQNHVQEDSGQKVLSIKKEEAPRLLPDVYNINKKALLESQPVYEKETGLHTEEKYSVTPPALAGVAPGSYIRTEKAETDMKYEKGPEIKENAEKKVDAEKEEKSVLGLPVDESFFNRDIKIEVHRQNAESHGVYMYLLKNSYLSLRKRHTWGKEKKIETIEETKRNTDAGNDTKTVFSVAKSGEGIYTFVVENRNTVPYNTGVVFVLYGGQKRERIKKISAVSVPPSSMLRFMFVLPDTVFWDDEKFFTGSIEDSDSITKFNDETGFVWKEGKDD
jgi:hypothetical protein